MKKLLIGLASFLFVVGYVSIAWAYGPKGSGSGYKGHGHSKHHFSRSSNPKIHLRHNQHYRPKNHNRHHRHKSHKRHRRHFRHNGHHHHKARHGRQRFYPYYGPYYRPLGRSYQYGYEDGPSREESPQAPQHTPSSRIYHDKNPEPWFLYGKGNEFRQMGLIPPLSQTSQELR